MPVFETTGLGESSRRLLSDRASQYAFFGVSALALAASAAGTIVWCASMSARGEMSMPGGWTMSMAWMRMPGKTWFGAAALFISMWVVMMLAMMLPSLLPMLWRYRQAVGSTGGMRLGWLTALVGGGYFFVWTVFGMATFPLGVALTAKSSAKTPKKACCEARAESLAENSMRVMMPTFSPRNRRALFDCYTGVGSSAPRFRKAASPASDTLTHFG